VWTDSEIFLEPPEVAQTSGVRESRREGHGEQNELTCRPTGPVFAWWEGRRTTSIQRLEGDRQMNAEYFAAEVFSFETHHVS